MCFIDSRRFVLLSMGLGLGAWEGGPGAGGADGSNGSDIVESASAGCGEGSVTGSGLVNVRTRIALVDVCCGEAC